MILPLIFLSLSLYLERERESALLNVLDLTGTSGGNGVMALCDGVVIILFEAISEKKGEKGGKIWKSVFTLK